MYFLKVSQFIFVFLFYFENDEIWLYKHSLLWLAPHYYVLNWMTVKRFLESKQKTFWQSLRKRFNILGSLVWLHVNNWPIKERVAWLISRKGYNWNNALSRNYTSNQAYNRVGLQAGIYDTYIRSCWKFNTEEFLKVNFGFNTVTR